MGNFWSCLSGKSNQAIASAAGDPVLEPIPDPDPAPSTIDDLKDGKFSNKSHKLFFSSSLVAQEYAIHLRLAFDMALYSFCSSSGQNFSTSTALIQFKVS